jgi:hypothetical protein
VLFVLIYSLYQRAFFTQLSTFQTSSKTRYEVTSKHTPKYNCFAWAVNDEDDRWWSPTPDDDYYWPECAPREETLESYIITFQMYGYEICSDGEIEPGFVKIAIYVAEDGTAKQLLHD